MDASPPPDPTSAIVAPAEAERRPNAVQLDLGLAVIGLAYERVFTSWFATQVEAQIFGTWFGPIFGEPRLSGFGGQVRPSFFLTENAPRGVYLAPFFRADRVGAEESGKTGNAIGFSSGAFAGYSFVFADRVNLRLGAGAQYISYVVDVDGTRVAFKTVFPAIDIVVGYLF